MYPAFQVIAGLIRRRGLRIARLGNKTKPWPAFADDKFALDAGAVVGSIARRQFLNRRI